MYAINNNSTEYYVLGLGEVSDSKRPMRRISLVPHLSPESGIESQSIMPVNYVEAFQNALTVKVNVLVHIKMNIRILDINSRPIYMRQYSPGQLTKMEIDISNWDNADFKITFENAATKQIFACGEFEIIR